MTRPFLSRALPNRLKEKLYYARFHTRHQDWSHLFESAPLALCPHVSMRRLIPGDVISGNIAFHGFYEWELTRRMVRQARRGGCLVDVGANMGYFSLLWAGLAESARVFAFEASPRNVELLVHNVKENGLADRITVIPKAAGHQAGSISFDPGPSDQTGWGGITGETTPRSITVPLVRLDEELPDIDVAVLKIDVEGADTWVLQGAERLLASHRIQTIFFEQHPMLMEYLGIREGEAQSFLRELGYDCMMIDHGEWMAVRGAIRRLRIRVPIAVRDLALRADDAKAAASAGAGLHDGITPVP